MQLKRVFELRTAGLSRRDYLRLLEKA